MIDIFADVNCPQYAPAKGWQAFKQRWYPQWALRRWPVKLDQVYFMVNGKIYANPRVIEQLKRPMGVP